MVKTYLKYEHHSSFGVISSANAIFGPHGKLAITAALEDISLWNVRQGIKVQTLHRANSKGHVTYLALSPDGVVLAAGYSDGSICLWDYKIASTSPDVGSGPDARAPEGMFRTVLTGHRTDVTALSFSDDGAVLVSGANDNEVIVWDVVSEKGFMRLSGHRNAVTACCLLDEERKVISGSRDGMVKVWDLDTQRCVQTLVGHNNPVWALAVSPDHTTLVTGSNDKALRVWKLGSAARELGLEREEAGDEGMYEEDYAIFFGTFTRNSVYMDHVGGLAFNKDGSLLACFGSESTFDIFLVFSNEEVKAKNIKKENQVVQRRLTPADFFAPLESRTTAEKIRSMAFDDMLPSRQLMVATANNAIHMYKLGVDSQDLLDEQKKAKAPHALSELSSKIDFEGHPTDVRFIDLSHDDAQILSVSTSCAKIFSTRTRKCTRTIPIDNAVCGAFIPGDMHAVVGTKIGKLYVIELASGIATEVEGAHAGPLWSVCVFPSGQGLATASADKTVKFWSFSLEKGKELTLALVKTLDVGSEAMSVCISPNSKHVAVALFDYTVKIFHMDSFQFFLSLYGHRLPVMSISISSDSALIATASADKNIKIWGMDFGDCHKSIFAHEGSVTQIRFVPNTHYLFTVGKDKLVKYWDADKFENIATLRGHHGEVWGLAISSSGRFIVTSSHDRSLRIWDQTDEPLFLEEERENAQDELFEEGLVEERKFDPDDPSAPPGVATRPSRTTMESVRGSERILEALTFMTTPDSALAIATLRGRTPEEYVFHTISQLRSSEVEEALLLLPYAQLGPLLRVMDVVASNLNMRHLELLSHTLFFLLSVHHKQLTLDTKLLPILLQLNDKVKKALTNYKRVLGMNKSAMSILQKELEHTSVGYQPLFKIEELQATRQRRQQIRRKKPRTFVASGQKKNNE